MSDQLAHTLLRLTAGVICLYACVSGAAQDWERTIGQFQHTVWTSKEGAPPVILSIAQTADGYLWLGSLSGLFRFDGVRFELYQPRFGERFPSNEIASLLALSDGSLWIGFRHGGASLLHNDHATNYGEREGLPSGRVAAFAQDPSGTIWAAIWSGGLARFENGRWKVVGEEWGFSAKTAQTAFVDRQGTLWVATDETVVFLPRGGKTFQPTGEHIAVVCQIAEGPDGRLWLAETSKNVRPIRFPDRHALIPRIRAGSQAILFDDAGAFWIPSVGDGIVRISRPKELGIGLIPQNSKSVEVFTHKDGLSDDVVLSIFEDREHNIWVGTPKGLERFRRSSLVPTVFAPGYQRFAMAAGDNGTVWIGSQSRPAALIREGGVVADAGTRPERYVGCGYRDANGEVWLGGQADAYHIRAGKISYLRLPLSLTDRSAVVNAITRDSLGRVWFLTDGDGIWRLEDDRWQRYDKAALPARVATAAYTDAQGRVWLGYGTNLVAMIEGDAVRVFSKEDGIATGGVKVIRGRNKEVWIGGEFGIAVFQQNGFYMLNAFGEKPFSGVSGIVEMADGSLWLSESRGVIHIAAVEVQSALRDPLYRARYRLFDYADGLPGPIQQVAPPTAIEGTDGRLWFATGGGLASIVPASLARNDRPPSVLVRFVSTGGAQYLSRPEVGLPARTTNLQVGYTALSLSEPEQVLFRYKLDGVDKDWQDAGTRREAFFTNLGPGHYQFHVTACNEDGVWNEAGATLDFDIAPAFYQTNWFLSLCIAAGLGFLYVLYQLRLQQVERQLYERLEARIEERTRIARELHDTLLQSFQGLLLRFHRVSRQLSAGPTKEMMDNAIDQAAQAITEGRDAVQDLRSSTMVTGDLAAALGALGKELSTVGSDQSSPAFHVEVEGTARELKPIVRDELYRIAGEALRNAFRHAQARRVEVVIHYDDSELVLHVRDDGKGIESQILKDQGRVGHWGLQGMRERTRKIGAQLEVWSRSESGTEVELRIPAAAAYQSRRASLKWFSFRRSSDIDTET